MNTFVNEFRNELETHILPFWAKLKDDENGGYYGLVDYDLHVHKDAGKGGIATCRQLWAFSAAYRVLKKEAYLQQANHAYRFLTEYVFDHQYKGLYWMVDYKGNPSDDRKHVYAQAFGVYALTEYYRVTQNQEALDYAKQLYKLIETVGFNEETNAYKEEFNRKWEEQSNEMLSENGVIADITMNTHLHVLEAYTNLYRVWEDEQLKGRIANLIDLFYEKVFDKQSKFLQVFFNNHWESIIDLKSYGHDIEASWLIDDALKVTGNNDRKYTQMVIDIAYNIEKNGVLKDGSLAYENENGKIDYTRVWWVQVEAMVGFYNAYEKTKDEKFLKAVERIWDYVKTYMIDSREGGEWYWSVEADDQPTKREIAGPWKCPYHNARFCLEFIERVGK